MKSISLNVTLHSPEVEVVFAAFREMHPRSVLTAERRKRILPYLKDNGVEICVAACRGIRYSPFHMGDNDRGEPYTQIEHIFKNQGNVEKFAEYELDPSTRPRGHRPPEQDRRLLEKLKGGQIDLAIAAKAWRQGRPLTDA